MREMKDSGVEWIGEIPSDWNCMCLKFAFDNSNVGESVDKELYSSDENGYIFYTAGAKPVKTSYTGFPNWKYTTDNDILLARNGTPYIYLPKKDAVYSDHIIRIDIKKGYDRRFLRYCLQRSIESIIVDSVSIATWSISLWKEQKLPMTSYNEQEHIADYLDSKCSQIDAIIEKQQAIIEKLKEYKLSVITEVVTKGLNANAEMKDSGVEWLGKYPAHWQYLSFKNVLLERNEKNIPVKTEERLSLSIDKGVTLYAEKTTNLDRFKDDVSQYKLAHEGDLVLNSMNMIVGAVGVSEYFGCVSPAYYTYYDTEEDHITTKYCEYLLRCKTMRKVLYSLGKGIMSIDRGDDKINTCRLKVSRNDLRALKIPVPPVEEQRDIVKYLFHKEQIIDKTISDREYAIAKLQEYKKSLIYQVVTGKKEV